MPPLTVSTAPFWDRLATHGAAPALLSGRTTLSYADLAGLVADLATRLGTTRRLVLLEARNDVATVVGYLACLAGGHPVLLADPDHPTAAASLLAAYDPDVVLGGDPRTAPGAGPLPAVHERRPGTAHDLHPDLALLLSTSGSTGSPKLVRLSRDNVVVNAAAIADYLHIRPGDVAATTLPLHYCYGLSVLTSHLLAGAAVLLTDASVVDPCFWDAVRRHRVSTFPAVPHTVDLLDRVGFADLDAPSLRYLTVAGGRLDPGTVRRYAALGQQRGFDLFVMYGATEATSRMAYLPPDLALAHPHTIGVPIPGGTLEIDAPGPDGVGELVYRGGNVMLGYAATPADLSRGREVTALRTGDLARRTPEGLVEVTGRAGRVAKVFGLRVDLVRVEQALLACGAVGYAADAGERVRVAVDRSAAPVDTAGLARRLTARLGLPPAAVEVRAVDGVPRLASGKVDYAALAAPDPDPDPAAPPAGAGDRRPPTVAEVYAGVLGRDDVRPEDTFVTLGGDSLSYVETSLRLERALGHLPPGWHLRTVADLQRSATGRRRRLAGTTVETNVVLRAAAIVAIVGSHANLFVLLGGAHLLVGLAGFNFGRFQVTDRPRRERVRSLAASIARIAVPSVLWLAFAAATSEKYGWPNVLLLNGVLGTREWSEAWHYWFVEALVWTLVGLTVLLAVPWVDRLERRWSFWLPFGLALAALVTRYDVWRLLEGDHIHRAHVVLWLFALGWAAAKAPTWRHRALVSAVVVLTVPGFFDGDQHAREAVIVAGTLLLVWLPAVRVPALLARAAGVLASASLYIYLVHWQVYPAYEFRMPWLATVLSLAAGVAFWLVVTRVTPAVESALGRVARRFGGEIREDRRWFSPRRCPTREECTAPADGASR